MKNLQLAQLHKQHPMLLLLSTVALTCLSLSVGWHFTIGLGILWFCLYAVTVRCPVKENTTEPCVAQSARSYTAVFILVILDRKSVV